MSYVGAVNAADISKWVERPVTPEEASFPGGALVAIAQNIAPSATGKEQQAVIRQIAAASGVKDPGSHSYAWARDLASEVMKRGGRRGPPTAANVAESGQGFAIIQAGNVWRLPPLLDQRPVQTAGLGWTGWIAAGVGVTALAGWWNKRRKKDGE